MFNSGEHVISCPEAFFLKKESLEFLFSHTSQCCEALAMRGYDHHCGLLFDDCREGTKK